MAWPSDQAVDVHDERGLNIEFARPGVERKDGAQVFVGLTRLPATLRGDQQAVIEEQLVSYTE